MLIPTCIKKRIINGVWNVLWILNPKLGLINLLKPYLLVMLNPDII